MLNIKEKDMNYVMAVILFDQDLNKYYEMNIFWCTKNVITANVMS